MTDFRPAGDALDRLESLRSRPLGRSGDAVVQMLQAWRFEVESEGEDGLDVYVFHPFLPDLHMGFGSRGAVHSSVVHRAVGLVDSLRSRLPAALPDNQRLGDAP